MGSEFQARGNLFEERGRGYLAAITSPQTSYVTVKCSLPPIPLAPALTVPPLTRYPQADTWLSRVPWWACPEQQPNAGSQLGRHRMALASGSVQWAPPSSSSQGTTGAAGLQ